MLLRAILNHSTKRDGDGAKNDAYCRFAEGERANEDKPPCAAQSSTISKTADQQSICQVLPRLCFSAEFNKSNIRYAFVTKNSLTLCESG
jgi:hypothetical protein